jgi:hypothetical protein
VDNWWENERRLLLEDFERSGIHFEHNYDLSDFLAATEWITELTPDTPLS